MQNYIHVYVQCADDIHYLQLVLDFVHNWYLD